MDEQPFKLLYDGKCPICRSEMSFLRRRDKNGRLQFLDIHAADFDPAAYRRTFDDLMSQIHGVYGDGRVVSGVEVFREAYRRIGLGWLLGPTGWPLLRRFFDAGYRQFARNRLRISRLFGRDDEGPLDCRRCSHFDAEP
jgi:predicted DCC family thiol-disulfide oxidoreductase YuxK